MHAGGTKGSELIALAGRKRVVTHFGIILLVEELMRAEAEESVEWEDNGADILDVETKGNICSSALILA